MDELTKYIFDWCPKLLTIEERKARNHLIGLQKIEKAESEGIKNAIERYWLSTDANILKLLKNGEEEFYKKVIERVFRDNPNKVFLNLCPKCNSLTRTPKSKQCPRCFYSWHNEGWL